MPSHCIFSFFFVDFHGMAGGAKPLSRLLAQTHLCRDTEIQQIVYSCCSTHAPPQSSQESLSRADPSDSFQPPFLTPSALTGTSPVLALPSWLGNPQGRSPQESLGGRLSSSSSGRKGQNEDEELPKRGLGGPTAHPQPGTLPGAPGEGDGALLLAALQGFPSSLTSSHPAPPQLEPGSAPQLHSLTPSLLTWAPTSSASL